MKRFRSKLAGFGFIVLAGSAVAADPKLLPITPPAQTVIAPAAGASDEPLVLPASVRFAAASEPAATPDPIWLPAARPLASPSPRTVSQLLLRSKSSLPPAISRLQGPVPGQFRLNRPEKPRTGSRSRSQRQTRPCSQ